MSLEIPANLDRRPFIGTYSILNAYKNCPHQMFRRYVKKDQPFVETVEMKWGNEVHTAFELRVQGGKPLPQSMEQWETFARPFDGQQAVVEQKLGINTQGRSVGFWDDSVWFRGKADLAIVQGDTAYINDWKTGKSAYEDPFELETNAVLLHAKHPGLKRIMGSYTWLKEKRISQMYNLSNTTQTWGTMCRLMAEILERKKTGEFEKKKSGLCGYCSVEDCENHYVAKK